MPFHHETVCLSGRLRSSEREAVCTVYATKVSLPGTDLHEFARLLIADAPENLPDGYYELTFEGGTLPVQWHEGAWLAPAHRD